MIVKNVPVRMLKYRDDIWYATNIDIYDYIDAYTHLIFSVDGKRVKNPSGRKVCFEYEGEIIEIEAGAMIEILVYFNST